MEPRRPLFQEIRTCICWLMPWTCANNFIYSGCISAHWNVKRPQFYMVKQATVQRWLVMMTGPRAYCEIYDKFFVCFPPNSELKFQTRCVCWVRFNCQSYTKPRIWNSLCRRLLDFWSLFTLYTMCWKFSSIFINFGDRAHFMKLENRQTPGARSHGKSNLAFPYVLILWSI